MFRTPEYIEAGLGLALAGLCLPLLAVALGACSRPTPSRPNPEASAATLEAAGAVETEAAIETARAGDFRPLEEAASDETGSGAADTVTEASGDDAGELAANDALADSEPAVATANPGAALDAELAAANLDPADPLSLCRLLGPAMAEALGPPADALEPGAADVEDAVWGTLLDGCQLVLDAAGADLAIGKRSDSLPEHRLRLALQAAGWKEAPDYRKLLPGETVSGFLRPGALCLSEVKLRPPQGSGPCGKDDPTCGFPPSSLSYEIALRCARF